MEQEPTHIGTKWCIQAISIKIVTYFCSPTEKIAMGMVPPIRQTATLWLLSQATGPTLILGQTRQPASHRQSLWHQPC